MCYSLWYNASTMLPAGSLEAEELPFQATGRNTQSSAPEDGWEQRPKHVELIGIINKPLLLHLIGVYIIYRYLPVYCFKLYEFQSLLHFS